MVALTFFMLISVVPNRVEVWSHKLGIGLMLVQNKRPTSCSSWRRRARPCRAPVARTVSQTSLHQLFYQLKSKCLMTGEILPVPATSGRTNDAPIGQIPADCRSLISTYSGRTMFTWRYAGDFQANTNMHFSTERLGGDLIYKLLDEVTPLHYIRDAFSSDNLQSIFALGMVLYNGLRDWKYGNIGHDFGGAGE